MARNRLGGLNFSVGLDTRALRRGLRDARQQLRDFSRQAGGGLRAGLNRGLGGVARRTRFGGAAGRLASFGTGGIGKAATALGGLALAAGAAATALAFTAARAKAVGDEMARARAAGLTTATMRTRANASADPFTQSRSAAVRRLAAGGVSRSAMTESSLGQAARAMQTLRMATAEASNALAAIFAPALTRTAEYMTQATSGLRKFAEWYRVAAFGRRQVEQVDRRPGARGVALGLLSQRAGNVQTAEAGSRELYNFFVQRQRRQQNEELAALRRIVELLDGTAAQKAIIDGLRTQAPEQFDDQARRAQVEAIQLGY